LEKKKRRKDFENLEVYKVMLKLPLNTWDVRILTGLISLRTRISG
jgi:hypothetical protein